MTDIKERPAFDLASELTRLTEARTSRGSRLRRVKRSWGMWGLVLWASLATALAVAALGEPGPIRRPGPAPDAGARPRLPEPGPPARAAEAPWTMTFRNFAYFETVALLQWTLLRQERERLAAEAENFRRQEAAGSPPPPGPAPAAPEKEEDPQWVGLPPAPGVLHLAPPPETEAEFAAELAAEAEAAASEAPPSALPPPDDLFHQPSASGWLVPSDPDLFFQPPPRPPTGPRSAYPEFLEEIFDPEAPAAE